MTQTRLMHSTVFPAEDRNVCDPARRFIPTALGSDCLREMELCLEVSRAVLWVAALTCLGTQVLL